MAIVTVDFETYYAKDFSLSKMTTEEYVNDPRFQVIGMGIKFDDAVTRWVTSNDIEATLNSFTWSDHAILCHNTLFDGAILAWKYGIKPGFWLDTLSMARAIHGVEAGGSLKALASRYGIGEKGDEVLNALGKRREDFTVEELDRYGAYCRNDVDLTYRLFSILAGNFPDLEVKLIDMTIRMFTEPKLMVDDAMLVERLDTVKQEKSELLNMLMSKLSCRTEEEVRKMLCSNPKFAEVLRAWGIVPPMKISKTTGKETFAFAKTDEEFIALSEHQDPTVQQLCTVRLGTKSTLEESRIARFIGIGGRNRGRLPVPLRYYGAHTGRWAGLDLVNFQNLPSRDRKKKALKNAIIAPTGYEIINCDSSQIEARVLAWLAGQDDVCSQFANGEDVYCHDASVAFGRMITKEQHPTERFIGKTMRLGLGYGTGAVKLHATLTLGGADVTEGDCKGFVHAWRAANSSITTLWRECDEALVALMNWNSQSKAFHIGLHKCLTVSGAGIYLPNGLLIRYPNLRLNEEGKMVYDSRKGPVTIWGGTVVENVVQALARIVVGQQLVWVQEKLGLYPVLTVHDAGVWVVPQSTVNSTVEQIVDIMSTAPDWAEGLPVACEAKHNASYGYC